MTSASLPSPRRSSRSSTHPRGTARGRIRVAARQGQPRGDCVPGSRERLRGAGDGAAEGAREPALRRDAGAHQADRRVRARTGRAATCYYSRTEEGKQYPVLCRKPAAGADSNEEVLLDGNALATGKPFWSLGSFAVSDDGNWLAYSTDTTGYRQYVLEVKDLRERPRARHSARAGHVGRVGGRQPDPVLHHGGRDDEAVGPPLPGEAGRPGWRDRAVRRADERFSVERRRGPGATPTCSSRSAA